MHGSRSGSQQYQTRSKTLQSAHQTSEQLISKIIINPIVKKIDTVDGAPKPLDEINLHFHLNDLENDNNKKEDSYKGRDYGKGRRQKKWYFWVVHTN